MLPIMKKFRTKLKSVTLNMHKSPKAPGQGGSQRQEKRVKGPHGRGRSHDVKRRRQTSRMGPFFEQRSSSVCCLPGSRFFLSTSFDGSEVERETNAVDTAVSAAEGDQETERATEAARLPAAPRDQEPRSPQ